MSLSSHQVCMDNMDSASDQHHQWLQATMHEDGLMDSSSSPSGADMLGPSQILLSERRLRPPQDLALKCPRCDSTHTKFCYYNNYSLSQPRYFCKTCRRYWTKGGTLRNIPVGGGFRKNRKSSSSNKKLSSNEQLSVSSINNQNTSLNMMMMSLPSANPSDLQLSFPLLQLPNMLTSSGNYTESMLFNKAIPMHDNNSLSNDGPIVRPTDHHKQQVVAMNHMTSKTNTYGGYFSTQFVEGGGYDDMQNVRYANNDYIGLSNYIDNNNNNNYSNSAAQNQLVEYSGLHEYQPNNIQIMHREVKPSPNMLALEWQQKTAGYPDANSNSKQDSSFCYDMSRSWWGMSSNTAGNTYHHPPATTHN